MTARTRVPERPQRRSRRALTRRWKTTGKSSCRSILSRKPGNATGRRTTRPPGASGQWHFGSCCRGCLQQQQEFFKARAAHGRSGWYYHEQVWLFQQGITHTAPRRRTGTGTSGAGQSADPQGKLPLVDTGRMREITLRTGPATFVGPVSGRRMTIKNLPWYLRISPQGAIQKEKALQAVVQPEVTKFARVVDKELQTFLSS